MQNYNDIQTLTQVDELSSIDLREEAERCMDEGCTVECWVAGAYNETSIEVLWLPEYGSAGVAWGGDAVWIDASSVDDALQRYFVLGIVD